MKAWINIVNYENFVICFLFSIFKKKRERVRVIEIEDGRERDIERDKERKR